MSLKLNLIACLLIPVIIFPGCSPRSRYEKRLKHELSTGVRCDSLFMGMYLGMTDKDFYIKCWQLNGKHLVKQGPGNTTVEYIMNNELKYKATMNFYPKFLDGKIVEMPVKYAYAGWAPWNRKLSSDLLEKDLLRYYKSIYGQGFISVRNRTRGIAYIKIDGNRRITIYKNDPYVWAVFRDLTVSVDSTAFPPQGVDTLRKSMEESNK